MRQKDITKDLIKKWYKDLLGNTSLNNISKTYKIDKRLIKKYIIEAGYDYTVVTKNRNKKISVNMIQNIEQIYSKDKLNQIINYIKNNSYNDAKRKYPELQKHIRAWKRYFKNKNINLKKDTMSEQASKQSKRKYLKWKIKNQILIFNLLKNNYSIRQISNEYFNNLKQSYIQYIINDYHIKYDKKLDTIYYYRLKYGIDETNKQLQLHHGKLYPMWFNQAYNKNKQIIINKQKEKYQKAYNQIIKNDNLFKQEIKDNYLVYLDFSQQYTFASYERKVINDFFKKYPKYCIFKNKKIAFQIQNIRKQQFKYDNKKRQLLDQVIKKYPEIIKNWPQIWNKNNNIYYAYIVNRIYSYRQPAKYLNYFLYLYQRQKFIFTSKQLCNLLGYGGYDSVSYASDKLVKTPQYKLLNNHLPLRKQYWQYFNGTTNQYLQEMKLLQSKNILQRWFLQKNWYNWKYLSNQLKLHCNNIDIVEKLIYKLYYDKYNQHLTIKSSFSTFEQKIVNLLEKNNIEYFHHNHLILNNKELDFYFPNYQLAIEINPTYTHNSSQNAIFENTKNGINEKKDPNYHWNKYKECQQKNITLISLFEKDLIEPTWSNFTKKFILSHFKNFNKIYNSDQIIIKNISNNKKEQQNVINFIKKYSEQSKNILAKYNYAIYNKQNKLLGICLFDKTNLDNQIELKQLVFLPNIDIKNGLNNVIKHFFFDYPQYNQIYGYSNNNLGNDYLYKNANFNFIKEIKPTLKYISLTNANDQYNYNVASAQSAKNGIIAKLIKPMNITNNQAEEIVINKLPHKLDNKKGYVKVYDTGKKLWRYSK